LESIHDLFSQALYLGHRFCSACTSIWAIIVISMVLENVLDLLLTVDFQYSDIVTRGTDASLLENSQRPVQLYSKEDVKESRAFLL
jgi:hypothetical protein